MEQQPHDSWAQYYDFVYQKTYGEFYDRFNELTLQTIQKILPYKGSILDFGAGTGRLSIPLTQLGYHVTAVEKSTNMAAILSQNAALVNINLDVFVGDISEYNNGKSDLALALFTVLSYTCSPKELQRIIENIKNHLNPNGLFFFDLPNTVFFRNISLLNKREPNFNRNVTLTPLPDNVYEYHEICSGMDHIREFSYVDTFNIRHWKMEEVTEILSNHGFIDTGLRFDQFASTGSDYRLYKLQ
ncbi:MAG: class I SAM-dependent methyltransferase [Bacteroidetes bacterium]|nr:class I SAM-dependent methyltransferase [Bacteroidota bacterium]MBM3424655.1 class I SAM-dependent methyltransferase [Bacteroidota bacterium]